jgi:hypothetical protein
MLAWFREHNQYEYVLLSDPDKAGDEWTGNLTDAIQKGGAGVQSLRPPAPLDPDEAILRGWWPSIL